MHDWPHRLHKLGESGTPAVVVTVAGIRGSAPRETGSKMIVTADGVQGTIGGGQLEHGCIAEARKHLDAGDGWRRVRRFALGSQCGQCCGGVVDVLFEHVTPGADWVASAFATFRAGARAALVTPLAPGGGLEVSSDPPRHREERSDTPRHREERSDVAISDSARQRQQIAAPASRARNDGNPGPSRHREERSDTPRHREERSDTPRHREERSDVAISERTRRRQEIATPAAQARNDDDADPARHREERSDSPRHREERSDAAISDGTRQRQQIAAPASRARNDVEASRRIVSSANIAARSGPAASGDAERPAMQRALRAAIDEPGSASVVTARGVNAASWLVEPIGPPPLTVVIFGAGHVGRACAQVLGTLDAAVFVVDGRADTLQGDWPDNVTPAFIARPPDFVAHCPPNTCYLVMTHDHALDLDLCREILARGDRRFCGLIGSASKRRRFEKRLRAAGYDEATIASLTCPIGAGGVTGKHPGEIAVAVAAQLLSLAHAAGAEQAAGDETNVAVFPGQAPGGRGRA